MGKGIGYGKVILFGEHFVVHGIPAIAVSIENKAIVEVRKSLELSYLSKVHGTIPELTMKAIKLIIAEMGITENFLVELTGDLPTIGGLGSSAAFCVALARAFADEYKLNLRDDKINAIAHEGEKAFHGNPSGIDDTMATYGGAMRFTRGKSPSENKFDKIKIAKRLHCVIGITGISSPTVKMVEKVRKFKEDDPVQFQTMCDEAGDIVKRGEKALATGDSKQLGELMNENQQLLQAIGVSIEQNERIIAIALRSGALGAKVTGGGGGGTCIILAKDDNNARGVENEIKNQGFNAFYTEIAETI